MTRLICTIHDLPRPCRGCLIEACEDMQLMLDEVEERAAIQEYDGGLTKAEAERQALRGEYRARRRGD